MWRGGREKRAKQIGITYPGKLVNARAKRWILTSMGTLYIQAFYPAVGLDRKKKKKNRVVVDRGPIREPKKGGNDSGRG